jgi:uncharacterized membrane protein YciS (DUF1049 family)
MSALLGTISSTVVHATLQAAAGFAIGALIDVWVDHYSVPIDDLVTDLTDPKHNLRGLGLIFVQTAAQFSLMSLSFAACVYVSMNMGLSSDPAACMTFMLAQLMGSFKLVTNMTIISGFAYVYIQKWLGISTLAEIESEAKAAENFVLKMMVNKGSAVGQQRKVTSRSDMNLRANVSSVAT